MTNTSSARLLLVVDSLDVGGAEWHVVELAGALRRRGRDVEVACSAGGELEPRLEAAGIRVHVLGACRVRRRTSPVYAWRLRRLVTAREVELVHAHVFASEVAAALAVAGMGIPLVVTAHSEACWMGPASRRWLDLIRRRADHVIAVTSGLAQRALARGWGGGNVSLVATAVARATAVAASSMRRDGHGGAHIGVVGRLVPEKGIDVLLEAAALLTNRFENLRVSIVGDGPERLRLERQAGRLGLDRTVCFLGTRLDVPRLMPRFEVLAVPSRSEGAPRVVLEAMAAGVPVVASAAGGIPEQIVAGRGGILVPPGNVSALAGALATVLSQPQLAERLGEAGRAEAEARDFDATMDTVESIYRGAVKARVAKARSHAGHPVGIVRWGTANPPSGPDHRI